MDEYISEPEINELEQNEYINETFNDLKSDFESHEKYEEGKEFVEENFWEKVEKVGKKLSFMKDVKALYNYMLDSGVPWYRKSIVLGALIYFITPIDSVPDLVPLVGYLDDLGVITAVLKFLGSELIPYYDDKR
jgi:uncharacterized membrane protein YkvA (DUF1232 family)